MDILKEIKKVFYLLVVFVPLWSMSVDMPGGDDATGAGVPVVAGSGSAGSGSAGSGSAAADEELFLKQHLVEVARLFGWVGYHEVNPLPIDGRKDTVTSFADLSSEKLIHLLAKGALAKSSPLHLLSDEYHGREDVEALEACARVWGYTLRPDTSDGLRIIDPFPATSVTPEAGKTVPAKQDIISWGKLLEEKEASEVKEEIVENLRGRSGFLFLPSAKILHSFRHKDRALQNKVYHLAWLITYSEFTRCRLILESYRISYGEEPEVDDRKTRAKSPERAAFVFARLKGEDVHTFFLPRASAFRAVEMRKINKPLMEWYTEGLKGGLKETRILLRSGKNVDSRPEREAVHYVIANRDNNSCVPYSLIIGNLAYDRDGNKDLFSNLRKHIKHTQLDNTCLLQLEDKVQSLRQALSRELSDIKIVKDKTKFKKIHLQEASKLLQRPIHIYRLTLCADEVEASRWREGILCATLHKEFNPPIVAAGGTGVRKRPCQLLYLNGSITRPFLPVFSHCQLILDEPF